MCGVCGCSEDNQTTIEGENGEHVHVLADGTVIRHSHAEGHDHHHGHAHDHRHAHDHGHAHDPGHPHSHPHGHGHDHVQGPRQGPAERAASAATTEAIEIQIFQKNDRLAERNRGWFAGRDVLSVNLMSSPGSGKTTLLERTLRQLPRSAAVLEGDQETPLDAERIRATGARAIQINTGKGCHLEADMVWHGIQQLNPESGSILFIENVGNLVCPALFDLGEAARVVLFSVTEGEDKPLKYPHMFRVADLVLLTKTDLVPHLDFDMDRALDAVRQVRPEAEVLQLSARSGEGFAEWLAWLERANPKSALHPTPDEARPPS